MNVASKELCQELYELSGWDDTYFLYTKTGKISTVASMFSGQPLPAYDAGFLLRKLPSEIESDGRIYRLRGGKNQYYFFEYQAKDDRDIRWWNISPFSKDFPEDALCALVIKLFKTGLLKKEGQS
jgi:hypothetical protein